MYEISKQKHFLHLWTENDIPVTIAKKANPYIFMYQSTNCSTLKENENENQLKWEKKWREIEQHKLLVLLLWFSTTFKKKNGNSKGGEGNLSRHLTPCPTGNCIFPVVFISITTTLNTKGQSNRHKKIKFLKRFYIITYLHFFCGSR